MNWDAIGSIGEIIGALAVLFTLAYLALQVRQNTNATRAASHHVVTDAMNQLNLSLAKDQAVAEIWLAGMSDRSSLNEVKRERFDALIRAYMHVCDTMYYHAELGAGDNGLWKAEERYLALILSSAGGKAWFEENASSISSGFHSALVDIVRDHDISSADQLTRSQGRGFPAA